MSERYHPARWQSQYRPVTDWEEQFAAGRWSHLGSASEAPRSFLIAGYVKRLAAAGAVLDAGCGEGYLAGDLDLSRFRYVGFDLSPTAVSTAHRLFPQANFKVDTIEHFAPEPGLQFSAVVFNETLPQLSDPLNELRRYRAFLADTGLMIVSLFQNPEEGGNGRLLTRYLDAEIAAGEFELVTSCEVVAVASGLRWRVSVLR